MNLLFLGHGRLAKVVAEEAAHRGHRVVDFLDSQRPLRSEDLRDEVDMVIETALPEGVIERSAQVLEAGKPLLIGTTGWYHRMSELQSICSHNNGTVLWASNFAPGVQIFRSLAAEAAQRLASLPGYRIELHEAHHLQKKDRPSGTAVHTAMDLLKVRPDWSGWIQGEEGEEGKDQRSVAGDHQAPDHPPQTELSIFSHRTENEVGTHTLRMQGAYESLEWTHRALNRRAFGWGAVSAAEWLQNRRGWYCIDDFYEDLWASPK
jgi:4-hydroxy-tetrahydrodipicolinate reductase